MHNEPIVKWFLANRRQLPDKPFQLGPGRYIAAPEKFYRNLDIDIAAGPVARIRGRIIPRQRWQPMLEDLAALKRYADSVKTPSPKPAA